MVLPHLSTVEKHQFISWPLQSFALDTETSTDVAARPASLFLDRANSEFGIVRYATVAIATVVQDPDTSEPVFFQATHARAAAWKDKCKKISLLFQQMQIDLEFMSPEQARGFLDVLEDLAMAAGNHFFCSSEVPVKAAFMRADFDMVEHGCNSRIVQPWLRLPVDASEWPRLRKTGEWPDFTIVAEGRKFPVHRVKICKESFYFKAVCSGGFTVGLPEAYRHETEQLTRLEETTTRSIELPESARTVDALLDEMYGAYNETTGSIFTNFAPRLEIEKERIMSQLLDLFIAADKYNLKSTKRKAAEAIIDRLPFITDALMVVDLATCIYHEQCPEHDNGLRKAVMAHIQARLPAILDDEVAWKDFVDNKAVLKAFHGFQCELREVDEEGEVKSGSGLVTPPSTRRKK